MSRSVPQKTILVVESNLNLRRLLWHELRRRSLVPELAQDGRSAIMKCRMHPVDLLVVDLASSNLGQLSFIETIKKQSPGVPVIVVSTFSSAADINRAFALGVDEFLAKPCPLESIIARIECWAGLASADGSMRVPPESEIQRGA